MTCGIYEILCLPTGQRYIGQSTDIEGRIANQFKDLRCGKHHNRRLQAAWIEFGPESFVANVLTEAPLNELTRREQAAITLYGTLNPDRGFNSRIAVSPFRYMTHRPDAGEWDPVLAEDFYLVRSKPPAA